MGDFVRFKKAWKREGSEQAEFAQALLGESQARAVFASKGDRKNQQLCRQVQIALNLALEGVGEDWQGCGIYVDRVVHVPGHGQLMVHVAVSDASQLGGALEWLRANHGRLRDEVAAVTSRKKAPQFAFVPAVEMGGWDE